MSLVRVESGCIWGSALGGWHILNGGEDFEGADGTAFEPVLNFRVAHLSRRVTGGAFDFGSSSDLNVTYDSSNNVLSESIVCVRGTPLASAKQA